MQAGALALHLQTSHAVVHRAHEIMTATTCTRGEDARKTAKTSLRVNRSRDFAAACLYCAFKLEKCPRQLTTVVRACGADPSEARKCVMTIVAALRGQPLADGILKNRVRPRDLINEFSSRLALERGDMVALRSRAAALDAELADRCVDLSREPRTVCCALIARAALDLGLRVDDADLRAACDVCAQVMHQALKELDALLA